MPRSNVVFRPTVVIGLGGTGYEVVLKLKKNFIDTHGTVPPIIRFLTFDTTTNVITSVKARDRSPVTLDPNEQYVVQIPNPAGLLGGDNPHLEEWWPRSVPMGAIIAGAGQVRARGRLALFAKSSDIFARIRNAIEGVRLIQAEKQAYRDRFLVSNRGGAEVYIVGSLAGGTGSGMFLDTAFIARSFIDAQSNITGVLVLPGIFTGRAGTQLVQPNAYGALKEIEEFSRLGLDYSFKIRYGGQLEVEAKQPPFDLLYLIDSTNETGNGVREQSELLSLVAQGMHLQIGSQIGTDSANTVDNIKTHLNVVGTVRNRSPKYCSFGVATLTLPVREYETLEIDAARQLLCDGLLNGVYADQEMEAEVVRFLQDHRLREDEIDDVIEALSEREGGGQMRFPIPPPSIKFDRTAQTMMKQLHVTHRSRMERQAAQGVETNYKRLLDASLQAIDGWWGRAINRQNGLNYATRFIEKILVKLEWYQHMMENEAREEQAKMRALNFKPLEEQIEEASGAFFRTEKSVQTACENYKGLVDRESELHLQVARRESAAELYGALRTRIENLLHQCSRIRLNMESALKQLEQNFLDASAPRSGESPFEHVLRIDHDTKRPDILAEEFIKWRNDQDGTLAEWTDLNAETVAREILNFVKERHEPLTGLPIDEVLRRGDPEQVEQNLNQLSRLAVPLWRYREETIPLNNRGVIHSLYLYGVEDAETTILKDPKISSRVPRGENAPSFVSMRDQQRVMLFKVRVGVPLFALHGIEEMERAYNDPDKSVSNHLHRDWESFRGLVPRSGEGDALRWFAIAQAPEPLGLVTRRGEWYFIRSKQAKRTDAGELKLGQGRLNAYTAFEKNRNLIKEVEEAVDMVTRTEGEARINTLLRSYVEQLAAQMSNVDTSIKEQVEREIEEIDRYLQRQATIR
ncbi:MAG: tubulin-like doman-containing protein [Acidobacteriota bacterium]|nr:tubulin-like doman-containing protein [Acidobacteriota bacterium]